jgi:hypothetical protein
VIGPIGLIVASPSNRITKTTVLSALARADRRVSAWSLVLNGLGYAAACGLERRRFLPDRVVPANLDSQFRFPSAWYIELAVIAW